MTNGSVYVIISIQIEELIVLTGDTDSNLICHIDAIFTHTRLGGIFFLFSAPKNHKKEVIKHERRKKPNYWAVIPADVLYDNELRPNAKLLYAQISALTNKSGYCYASNKYLAKLFGIAKRTLGELLQQLTEKKTIYALKSCETERTLSLKDVYG